MNDSSNGALTDNTPQLESSEIKRLLQRIATLFADWIVAPIDVLPLRLFESAFAISFLLMIGYNLLEWQDWITASGFHLTVEDSRQLGYPAAMPVLKTWQVPLFVLALLTSVAGVVLGRYRRLSLMALFSIAIYSQAADYLATSAQNRICIAVFGLLATGPGPNRDNSGSRISRVLPIILMLTLVIIYFDAGFTKAFNGGAWLKYDDCLKLAVAGFHRTELASIFLTIIPDGVWSFVQYCVLLFEIGAPILFFNSKTKNVALIFGLVMHVMIGLLMMNVWFLSLQTLCFYILFVSPHQVRSFFLPRDKSLETA